MFRIIVPLGRGHAVTAVALVALATIAGRVPTPPASVVSGRMTVMEKGNKLAGDVGQAVLWLEAPGAAPAKSRKADVIAEEKEFRPHISVVAVGSTVSFPNHDPFNHNVFSLSQEASFDLGLYSRGQVKSVTVGRPGIIKVYCNVHATMSAFLVVRDNGYYGQPAADGSFTIEGVPPGHYVLHAWHERAGETTQPVDVTPAGAKNVVLELDARGYKFVQHVNKFGQPYAKGGARY